MTITPIISEYNNNPDLLFKKIPYFNLILPDFIEKQFEQITSEFTKEELENFYYEYNRLVKRLDYISKTYGDLIKDFFLTKLKEIFEVPDFVEFNNDNEMENLEFSEDNIEDEDDKEDYDDMIELLKDEIGHLMILDAFVNGGSFVVELKILELIKSELNSLEKNIFEDISKFLKYSILLVSNQVPKKNNMFPIAGTSQIKLEEPDENNNAQKIKITVKGKNIVIVCNEMSKGLLSLLAENKFISDKIKNSNYRQKFLRENIQSYYHEQWHWIYGVYFWNEMIEKRYNKESYFQFISRIFGMEYNQLLDFLISK